MHSIFSQTKKQKTDIPAYLFSPGAYRTMLSRRWAEGLLYAIFVALAFPILLFFITSNIYIDPSLSATEAAESIWREIRGFLGTESPIAMLWGTGSGVISALLSVNYLFDKRQAGFVCALPVKRSAYAVSSAAAGVCIAILSWIPAAILFFVGVLCTPSMSVQLGQHMLYFAGAFLTYLSVFLFFFGLTSLAAALCGSMPMTILITAFLACYPLLLTLLLTGTAESFIDRINWSYYVESDTLPKISSVVRIFGEIVSEKSASFLLSTAGLGILYFAVFVLFTRTRKNEATGQHFVWSFAREGIKYLCMILVGITMGLLFYLLSDRSVSILWMLIGTAIGATVVWMLCNLVFFKTSTMLFYAKRGLVITLACLLLFMGLLPFDILGLEHYVPSTGMISSITFRSDIGMVDIKDKALIRMYRAMVQNGIAASKQDSIVNLDTNSFGVISSPVYDGSTVLVTPAATDSSIASYPKTYINTVFHTKYLIPIARHEHVLLSDYRTFLSAFAESDSFVEAYIKPLYSMANNIPSSTYAYLMFYGGILFGEEGGQSLNGDQITEFAKIYEQEVRALGTSPMQNQIIGTLQFFQNNTEYPIFEGCTESIAWLEDTFLMKMPDTPSEKRLSSYTKSISLCYEGTPIRELTPREFLAYLETGDLSYETALYTYDTGYLHFTLYDVSYTVRLEYYADTARYWDPESGSMYYEEDIKFLDTYTVDYFFFEGKAPKS